MEGAVRSGRAAAAAVLAQADPASTRHANAADPAPLAGRRSLQPTDTEEVA
jgi:hypothetical protein